MGDHKVLRIILIGLIVLLIGVIGGVLMAPEIVDETKDLFTNKSEAVEEIIQETNTEDVVDNSESVTSSIVGTTTVKDIAKACSDCVVKIVNYYTVQSNYYGFDSTWLEFFGYQIPETTQQEASGSGSGFLFTNDGYILTNYHVIENANRLEVYLNSSETPIEATVVGTAKELDLAVIKIEGSNYPYLDLGDSDKMEVGDWVVAIGNPYGLDHTVTVGVISATGRPVTIEDTMYQNLLQTDAAINPGNSGGPMLNLSGEVIGINCATNSVGDGIGFAIPSNVVSSVLDELKAGDERVRPWIGVSLTELTSEFRKYFNIPDDVTGGVIVSGVVDKGPADKAGIEKGDVILSVDDTTVSSSEEIQSIVKYHLIGDKIKVKIFRDGNTKEITVELEAAAVDLDSNEPLQNLK